jgi:hypothetical protein
MKPSALGATRASVEVLLRGSNSQKQIRGLVGRTMARGLPSALKFI